MDYGTWQFGRRCGHIRRPSSLEPLHFAKSPYGTNFYKKRKLVFITLGQIQKKVMTYRDIGDRTWKWTEAAPALSPNNVTLSGSPLNCCILSRTHRNACT